MITSVDQLYILLTLSQVDDPQKGTDDVPHGEVPVVIVPRGDDQTSDGTNQNKIDPRVRMYTYVCMYVHKYMHVCVYLRMYVCMYIHIICMYVCMHVSMYVCKVPLNYNFSFTRVEMHSATTQVLADHISL